MTGFRDELDGAPLGHATTYPDAYDAALLFAVPRAAQRAEIGITGALPFGGTDQWTAFELTWLDPSGKPEIAIATFSVPVTSPAIVESKSVKLYLGAFAQTRFDNREEVRRTIARDLAGATGGAVAVTLHAPASYAAMGVAELDGESLDALPLSIQRYHPAPDSLAAGGPARAETLRTDLFRSLCPITLQPDFASVAVAYRGPAIDRAGLLRYLVSFRNHTGFHEHCVERIFVEVMERCRCEMLSVHARFTRRGGVDINPFRSSAIGDAPPRARTARQ
jgi:7-cyano-7-deazaguanine reductase